MYQAASPTARTPARPLAWLLVRFCRIIGPCHQRAASRRLGVDRPDFGRGGFSLGRFHMIKTENISDNVLKITAPEKGLGAHDAAVLMIDTSIIRVISTVPALLGTEHSRWAGQEAG